MSPSTATVTTDQPLCDLLRAARARSHLSQSQVAPRAHVSVSWYRRVETCTGIRVGVDSMLDICDALGVMPRHLRELTDGDGEHQWDELADQLLERNRYADLASPYHDPLEAYLWQSPCDGDLREALIAYSRSVREMQAGNGHALPRHSRD